MLSVNDKKSVQKNFAFEYIRAFSIVAVITIHTFYSSVLQYGSDTTMVLENMYRIVMNLMWWAVPCFLMLSGSLLLNREKTINIEKLYNKYILRMVLVLLTFGWFYAWLELFFTSKSLIMSDVLHALINVLTGNTWAHMWYIYCMIGIYVLLPLWKIAAKYLTDREFVYLLVVLLIFNSIFRLSKIVGIDLGFYCHINTIYPFWFLMGEAYNRGFLDKITQHRYLMLLTSSLCLVLLSLATYFWNLPFATLFGYDSVFVVIQAVSIFTIIVKCKFTGRMGKILCEIADKSFGIYLIHMFFINLAFKFFKINPFQIKFIFGGLLLVILNLVISYICVWIMKKIPLIKKIV